MEKKLKTLREVIYYGILEDISAGKILPGEKLLEAEIAKRFNVSRTPVREAIMQLTKRGLVDQKSNAGAVVKKFSSAQLVEFLDIISVLEGRATEIVAENGVGDEDIEMLTDLNDQMIQLCENYEFLMYWPINETFHTYFLRKCGNQSLCRIVSDLRKQIYRTGLALPRHSGQFLLDHQQIIEAIIERNSSKAGELMKEHMRHVKLRFIELFELLEKQSDMRGGR
jgi:DNA-binding GntR family transcriptional regulator